ncbi:hypothetical protein [Serratia sp. 2723]|uniref:hypothetical protein n=1 Tax=unclassified Serratia (in: enterobacteria) TaxID=2647522 RepID=UPI003D1992E5
MLNTQVLMAHFGGPFFIPKTHMELGMDNHNMPPGLVEACIMWLKINSPTLYGIFAAFGMVALITLRDGKGWHDCFYAGAISGRGYQLT